MSRTIIGGTLTLTALAALTGRDRHRPQRVCADLDLAALSALTDARAAPGLALAAGVRE